MNTSELQVNLDTFEVTHIGGATINYSVVILSGGLDSSVLLLERVYAGDTVTALSVDYGQRHGKELDYAAKLCKSLGVTHEIADLRAITSLIGNSSQTNQDIPVPLGHYEEENMKQTVVPNRNMIMLAVAAGLAGTIAPNVIVYFGAHGGDHAIYPDCRGEFVDALNLATMLGNYGVIQVQAPFIGITKAEIVTLGYELSLDFNMTWSCYQGGEVHCGRCGTCVERREAFIIADVPDPTPYEATLEETVSLLRGRPQKSEFGNVVDMLNHLPGN